MGVEPHSGPVELRHDPSGSSLLPPDQGFFDSLNGELTDKGFLVTSAEELFQWARTGHLPIRRSVADSAEFKALPHRADLAPLTTNGAARPAAVKRQFAIQEIENDEVTAGVTGDKEIDAALADAQSRINELLANAK